MVDRPTQTHPRFHAAATVSVVTDDARMVNMAIHDVSLGGMFLCTPAPRAPGRKLHVELRTEDGVFSAAVRVVHVLDGDRARKAGRLPGMGVRFEMLSERASAMLSAYIHGLPEVERVIPNTEPARWPGHW